MKHLLSPAVAFLLMLLCLPEFSSSIIAQTSGTDNPIMIIRCRNFEGEALKKGEQTPLQSKMMTGCPDGYTATIDGGCVPMCPPQVFGTTTIEYEFNPANGLCEEINCTPGVSVDCSSYCPGDSFASVCDPCLSDNAGTAAENYLPYDSTLGACYKSCFDGAVAFDLPTVNCDTPLPNGNVAVELCFRSADPTMPLQDGQQVAISDISNCLNDFGQDFFLLAQATLSGNQNYGFGSALNGEICISFFADPTEPIIINLSNQVDPVEIPVCPDAIPSMGQWALMILALMLSSLGLVFLAKRRLA